MQEFPSRQEEIVAREKQLAAYEDEQGKRMEIFKRVAGRGLAGVRHSAQMKRQEDLFKALELDQMREDIRALKDAVNTLIRLIQE